MAREQKVALSNEEPISKPRTNTSQKREPANPCWRRRACIEKGSKQIRTLPFLRQEPSTMPESVNQVLDRIKRIFAIESWLHFPIIVAVSGGPDSVALLRLLHQLKNTEQGQPAVPLIVAHVNHGLRGKDSVEDEAAVCRLAKSLGLKYFVTRLSMLEGNSEEQLRDARYQFLLRLAHEQGARVIATGHNADDQVETVLFRIFRGTGIGGLVGIPQISSLDDTVSIIRPLLTITRAEIETVLQAFDQTYCVDESNRETRYTRNFLRHQIIPEIISKFGPQFSANLRRLALQANEVEAFLNQQASQLAACIFLQTASEVKIHRHSLALQPQLLVRQFFKLVWTQQVWPLQEMSYDKWQQLAEMVNHVDGLTTILPGNIRCEVVGSILVLKNQG